MRSEFKVSDIKCSACVSSIEKAVKRVNGVSDCVVVLAEKTVYVTYDNCELDDIKNAVRNVGYTPDGQKRERSGLILIFSAVISALLMFFEITSMTGLYSVRFNKYVNPLLSAVLALVVIILNYSYFYGGVKRLVKLSPDMSSLVAVGSLSSFVYAVVSYLIVVFAKAQVGDKFMGNMFFASSAMIVTIVSLGKFLEGKAVKKTNGAIEKLVDLTPEKARKLFGENEIIVNTSELKVGDTIALKNGDKIPTDGVLLSGAVSVNQATITGESVPAELCVGDTVRGGTIVVGGACTCRVTAVGKDTSIGRIIELVRQAGAKKVPIARVADRVASVFVPTVFAIAVITFIVWCIAGDIVNAVNCGVCVLVVSCPCALGLATPVAIMTAVGAGATSNILIKSGSGLEYLARSQTVCFDKTGTLTYGKPQVVQYYGEQVLSEVYSIEKLSSHPIAVAICEYALKRGGKQLIAQDFNCPAGLGVTGRVGEDVYKIGNEKFLGELPDNIKKVYDEYESNGLTCVAVQKNGLAVAVFGIFDTVRQDAGQMIESLKQAGIKTVMLTGDNEQTAKIVSKELGVDEYHASLLPDGKAEIVEQLGESEKVCFVGDGINDAPAMTVASVGVAVGSGADVAIDSADVIITSSDCGDFVRAVKLSKATVKNVKQNIFWAFFYNVLAIPVACGAFAFANFTFNPMIASACMSLSSLCVVFNALRLNRFRKKEKIKMIKVQGKIQDMMCEHCVKRVNKILSSFDATDIKIDLATKQVEFSVAKDNLDGLFAELKEQDYPFD